jgi:hypothetical protein
MANSSSAYASDLARCSWSAMLCYGEAVYFDVDFTGLLDRFLFYECNHPLEFVRDLFIAEAVRTGHDVDQQSVACCVLWFRAVS